MTAQPLAVITAVSLALAATGCGRNGRMPPDQQIGLIEACEQARREGLAAAEAERDQAISRWAYAVARGKGLCTNDLHDALVLGDDRSHELALQVVLRTDWRQHTTSLLSDLGSDGLSPEQLDRVVASLKALSGRDFGKDRAAWESWFRGQPAATSGGGR